jgi:eukaryotic-like serine/threonine-protein kinase
VRLAPGLQLGPYEVLAALGVGGMAEVYRARDTRLGREVALKVVNESLVTNPGLAERTGGLGTRAADDGDPAVG